MSFKKGDHVKVIRGRENKDTDWVITMNSFIGEVGIIVGPELNSRAYIEVNFEDNSWWFPIDALELVVESNKIKEMSANKKTQSELYLELQEQVDIKVGDTIKLVGTSASYQFGWSEEWDYSLDDKFENEEIALVEDIDGNTGYIIKFIDDIQNEDSVEDCTTYYVPFFVLEKIDDYKFEIIVLNDDYTAFITENGVKVGCQTIDLETIVEVGK